MTKFFGAGSNHHVLATLKPKSVALIGTCPRCGESVELIVSKKQIKAIMKGFKASSPQQAERISEKFLGRDKKGNLKQ